MYPHLKEELKFHYINDYAIVTGGKDRMLSDIDIYIFDKLTGEKTIDNVIDEIAIELGAEERSQIEVVFDKFLDANNDILKYEEKPAVYTIPYTGERNMKYPSTLILSLTNRCNLTCKHCYKSCNINNKDFLPYDELIDILEKVNGKVPGLQLTGGEPMLHERFFDILKYCNENFGVNITTTATLITEENAPKFKGTKSVQISLYSHIKEKHEQLTNTKGSYDKTVNGIKQLVKNDINVSVAMLANHKNLDEIQLMLEFLLSMGVKRFSLGSLSKCGRGLNLEDHWFLDEEHRVKAEDLLLELGEKYKGKIDIEQWNDGKDAKEPEEEEKKEDEKEREGMGCGAGTLTWCISAKGNILPCDFFPEDLFTYGNILERDMIDIVKDFKLDKLDEKMITWDKELREVNSSVKEICEKMEFFREKSVKKLAEASV
ncbi:radical SAM protein [Clostridiaceae bacterium M8S5]|nr:radical SAM protein [Clostridiaceae bacterium M8S5]